MTTTVDFWFFFFFKYFFAVSDVSQCDDDLDFSLIWTQWNRFWLVTYRCDVTWFLSFTMTSLSEFFNKNSNFIDFWRWQWRHHPILNLIIFLLSNSEKIRPAGQNGIDAARGPNLLDLQTGLMWPAGQKSFSDPWNGKNNEGNALSTHLTSVTFRWNDNLINYCIN